MRICFLWLLALSSTAFSIHWKADTIYNFQAALNQFELYREDALAYIESGNSRAMKTLLATK
ncbi:MAG: hypothetical protein HC896_15585 [Bacteroidales bacterium]|nr:hypothetical protein [Bacteroidales bacterium]